MADKLALVTIVLAGAYLLGLALLSFVAPTRATRFLGNFAGSASAHYLELGIRFAIGLAVVHHAPEMPYPNLFQVFGWVLLITTIPLLVAPWQWHQAIAKRAVPFATAHLRLFALSSAILGAFVLWSALRGTA